MFRTRAAADRYVRAGPPIRPPVPPTPDSPLRLAVWSGPRTLSTAFLRAWGNRPDTAATDEPLYAHYLATTGLDHPGRAAVLASQPADWRAVARALTGPVPGGRALWVQKHMAHHLTPDVGRGWLDALRPVFLVRDPARMLRSFDRVVPDPQPTDTGLPQQAELFDREAQRRGEAPPVVDTDALLHDPEGVLRALCARLGVPFRREMLAWPPGPRAWDGAWAPHWYGSVERSTGFGPPPAAAPHLPDRLRATHDAVRPLYTHLAAHAL